MPKQDSRRRAAQYRGGGHFIAALKTDLAPFYLAHQV